MRHHNFKPRNCKPRYCSRKSD